MPDYKTLYHNLFNSLTGAITLLQKAQLAAEETICGDAQNPPALLALTTGKEEDSV